MERFVYPEKVVGHEDEFDPNADRGTYYGDFKKVEGEKAIIRHGNGMMVYRGETGPKARDVYMGDWVDDKFEGFGKIKLKSGYNYSGNWKGGLKDGRGYARTENNSVYKGMYKDGKRQGRGEYKDS